MKLVKEVNFQLKTYRFCKILLSNMGICKVQVKRRCAEPIRINSYTGDCNYYEMYLFKGTCKKGHYFVGAVF